MSCHPHVAGGVVRVQASLSATSHTGLRDPVLPKHRFLRTHGSAHRWLFPAP